MADAIPSISAASRVIAAAQAKAAEITAIQVSAEDSFNEWADSAFNPLAAQRRFEKLEDKLRKKTAGSEEVEKRDEADVRIEKIEAAAEGIAREHPDMSAQDLIDLFLALEKGLSLDELFKIAGETFEDPSLVDKALDFLIENSSETGKKTAEKAKERLYNLLGREVKAGLNIEKQAYKAASVGLGSASFMRDLYRNLTAMQRTTLQIFKELFSLYNFEKISESIEFLLASLGLDLNAKGPSIERAQLQSLQHDCQSLQSILGLYKFFNGRTDMLYSEFERYGLAIPDELHFESLTKSLLQLIEEKYPSPSRVLDLANGLGVKGELVAQYLALAQLRDALLARNSSAKFYKDNQHRQDLIKCAQDALDELDQALEEEDDQEDSEEQSDEEQ